MARKRRLGMALSVVACGAALAGVGTLAFGALGQDGASRTTRISLRLPGRGESLSPISAAGRLVGATASGHVELQIRDGRQWRSVARKALRNGRFELVFSVSREGDLEVRAIFVTGGRMAAVSPIRRIAVLAGPAVPPTAARPAAGPSPTSAAEPGGEPPAPPVEEPPPAATNVYWGGWIGSQLTGEEAPWDMGAVADFEGEAGKAPSLVEFASPFADCSHSPCSFYPFPSTPFEDIRARGAIPLLSWSSQSLPSQVAEPEYELADVAAGDYDTYIKEFAAAAAAWGHPFFLRFDWEMNGAWFPWGAEVNGNTPADYVAAWRHVHHLFVQAGATDATWVWCPYVDPNSTLADLASLYPGDEYVDWTCLDGYNWGPSARPPRKWRSFSYLFGPTYREITETIAPTRPLMVAETASSEEGGSKQEWIAQAFDALPTEFPRIQGLVWFDKYDDGMDWPLGTSAGAIAAFATGIGDPRYLGNVSGALDASPIPAP